MMVASSCSALTEVKQADRTLQRSVSTGRSEGKHGMPIYHQCALWYSHTFADLQSVKVASV